MGVLHPEVLKMHDMENPVALLEIEIETIANELK